MELEENPSRKVGAFLCYEDYKCDQPYSSADDGALRRLIQCAGKPVDGAGVVLSL